MHSQHTAQAPFRASSAQADRRASRPAAGACIEALQVARARTLALFDSLAAEALLGPRLAIVNPPLWEFGHLGWFQERWLLRPRADGSLAPSRMPGADALYDSSAVPHATRWDLPLPTPDATRAYLAQVLAQASDTLAHAGPVLSDSAVGRGLAFHATVCAQHEQMHAEAFTYSRQTLGYPALAADAALRAPAVFDVAEAAEGDVRIDGGTFLLGAGTGDGFAYDNEKQAHAVTVASFAIARSATTCAAFAAFVDDGGYDAARWWSDAGWRWRQAAGAAGPAYWRPMLARQGWEVRDHDAWHPLHAEAPMLHVNAHEAEAWCRWAGRRLPTEAEWEFAASGGGHGAKRRHPWGEAVPDPRYANLWFPGLPSAVGRADALPAGDSLHGCRQMIGNAWEWTASPFEAYPGFQPDPYREYSAPWFGTHRVLRGGCFATAASLIRNTWRNFFTPDRRDVHAGFRTCALGER
ncbi:MAG: selenoneine synthase SenA [bacterium]|jgi:iron(II)-dependent oxidoreductase|nr:SUMF1/EgtB/PvdO family nonheme iron enzyme [Betaproteobacteria bacterium]